MIVEFIIPGAPVAKGRPRFTRAGRTYTPAATAAAETRIRECARRAIARPLVGAVRVEVLAFHPIPKSWPKGRREGALFGGVRPTTCRQDVDNIAKAVLDGMNGIAYADDRQVVELLARQFYGADPRVQVKVERIGV